MVLTKRYYLLLFFIATCFSLSAQQNISVTPEKDNIILGEPLKLNIRISGDKPYEASIPDSLGKFEVLRIGPVENRTSNGAIITDQQLLITCFDSGQFRIPPIAISGKEAIVSAGFDISVTPLPADSTQQYGDIKQIISLEAPDQLPYQIAVAALVLLSGWMIWRLNQKHAVIAFPAQAPTPPPSPHSLVEQLRLLKTSWQQQEITSVAMGNELMDITRKYFAGRGIYTTSKTGEELIVASKAKLNSDIWMDLAQSIRLCNAMRFGRFEATAQEGIEGINAIEKTIQPISSTPAFNPVNNA